MIKIRLATKKDYNDYIAFANSVFSTPEKTTDFPKLLPKIYAPGNENLADNYLAVDENGRIVGLAARNTMEMTVSGALLKGGYIGTVSVSPDSRGQGIMRLLMEHILAESRKEGFAFLSLDGSRQRYGYYGFSPSGERLVITITKDNVIHALRDLKTDGFKFIKLSENEEDSLEALKIHETRNIRFNRSRPRFSTVALSFGGQGYLIERNNETLGYLIVDRDSKEITDLYLVGSRNIPMIIKAWMEFSGSEKSVIHAGIYDRDIITKLSDIAEKMSSETALKTRIIDFETVTETFLKIKAGYTKLNDGIISLKIDENELTIRVKDNNVSVTNGCETNPLILDTLDAGRFLMDPYAYRLRENFTQNWFPLPFYVPRADSI